MTSSQLCLYKSADLKINITVSFDPQDRFGHSKIHFGEVFQVQGAKVPKVIGDKRCKGESSEGLLWSKVFSRTHFISSLSPEEGPSCSL